MSSPDRIVKNIDTKHWARASRVPGDLVGPYLDAILVDLHQKLDVWRYHKGPPQDVEVAMDAFYALWTHNQQRTDLI